MATSPAPRLTSCEGEARLVQLAARVGGALVQLATATGAAAPAFVQLAIVAAARWCRSSFSWRGAGAAARPGQARPVRLAGHREIQMLARRS
jgi:hypothetical protein